MSDPLQQLSSFLNLSKLVAVTVPGIVATCALLLFFNPPACVSDPQNPWYSQGQTAQPQAQHAQQGQSGSSTSKSTTPPTRAPGSYLASKLTWEQTDPYKLLRSISQTDLRSCAAVPEYLLPTSRLKTAKNTVKNLGDLEAIDPRAILDTLDRRNTALSVARAELNRMDSADAALIQSKTAVLTALTTSLTTAQNAANIGLVSSVQPKVDAAKRDLDAESQKNQDLLSALAAEKTLATQVTGFQTAISGDVAAPIPVVTPTPTPWQTAAAAIGSNILMFAVVCVVIGQLLDPIQRSLTSVDPIRGLTFPFLTSCIELTNRSERSGSATKVIFGLFHVGGHGLLPARGHKLSESVAR